ncbi:MAG: nitrate reductase molybdenum cofactor assembly chaperone [Actinobacteria bacterium]|nr:nitrate reductase molybdenum cofactor assembly chaperone [Actinomycetota bacterium]
MALRSRRRERAGRVYEVCSLLLRYPDAELGAATPALRAATAELPRGAARAGLERFFAWWGATAAPARAAHYVEAIDLNRRSGLYLTFYSDGDKRERGSVLVRLKQLYRAAGLPLEGTELPDYLPVMLEFAASAPGGRGEIVLRENRAALELVRAALRDLGSPYADLLDAVCAALGEPSAAERALAGRLAAGGPPQELVGLEPFAPPEVMPGAGSRR